MDWGDAAAPNRVIQATVAALQFCAAEIAGDIEGTDPH